MIPFGLRNEMSRGSECDGKSFCFFLCVFFVLSEFTWRVHVVLILTSIYLNCTVDIFSFIILLDFILYFQFTILRMEHTTQRAKC